MNNRNNDYLLVDNLVFILTNTQVIATICVNQIVQN